MSRMLTSHTLWRHASAALEMSPSLNGKLFARRSASCHGAYSAGSLIGGGAPFESTPRKACLKMCEVSLAAAIGPVLKCTTSGVDMNKSCGMGRKGLSKKCERASLLGATRSVSFMRAFTQIYVLGLIISPRRDLTSPPFGC